MKQRKFKWTTALGVATVAAATAAAANYLSTKYFLKLALDRQQPIANQPMVMKTATRLLTGMADEEAFFAALDAAKEALGQKENETVSITAADGETLVGHWIGQENAKRVIIAMHGWRSSWNRDFGMVADAWAENGCSVLFAEQRGQNNSGGDHMGFGLTERFDCLDWVRWVTKRVGTDLPIYLCGVSMGATTVLMADGLGLPSNVHGIMADCGFTSPHAIFKHIANDNLHISYCMRGAIADVLMRKKLPDQSANESTVDALKKGTVPVLFIHGTDDHFVPVTMTYANYKACTAPKRLFVVPGADHGMSYFVDKEGYEKAVKDFWQEFDAVPSAGEAPAE
ncbi:MAG: alpha/beta hydrolase [Acutalibacteraceae bacterium]